MLGAKIKVLREQKNLTQAQLGAIIGVGQSTIAMYECGRLTPPARNIMRLGQALGVQPADLLACVELEPVPA